MARYREAFVQASNLAFLEYSLVYEKWFGKPCQDSSYYKKEQTFWGLKGFVLEDTPVSRGSC